MKRGSWYNLKEKAFFIIFHPITLALLITAISAWFIFPQFEDYTCEQAAKNPYIYTETKGYAFHDLNQDGNSERILMFNNRLVSAATLMISLPDGSAHFEQYNFKGEWFTNGNFAVGDYNNNHFQEIYVFTRVNDSLFMHIIEPLLQNGLEKRDIYLGNTQAYNQGKYHVLLAGSDLYDSDNDGLKEFHFIITAGYSLYPRNYYQYDIEDEVLRTSPKSGIVPYAHLSFKDIDNDGYKEVCGQMVATSNYHTNIPYPDSSTWIMVFTRDAEFLFPPIEIKGEYGNLKTTFVEHNQQDYILSIHQKANKQKATLQSELYLFDIQGHLINKKILNIGDTMIDYYFFQHPDYPNALLFSRKGAIFSLSENLTFHQIKKDFFEVPEETGVINAIIDANGDGKKELIFQTNLENTYLVSSNLKQSFRFEIGDYQIYPITVKKINGETYSLIINSKNAFLEFRYYKNKYAWLKFPLIVLIFSFSYLMFFMLAKMQKQQLERRYEEEKKIQKYQYQGLRNQLDPHFSLNILNSIQSLFHDKDFEKAKYLLSKYGKLNRIALHNSEKIAVSLEDELEFVESFLALEKFRYEDRFDYLINMDEEIEAELIQIPRMLIQTFVENAIKHGLFPKGEEGMLKIEINESENVLLLKIEDNGIGRIKSKELKTSNNGKGLNIISEIITLYNKLNNTDISFKTIDLYNEITATGTRVEILIPQQT